MWINSYFFVVHICTKEGKALIILLDFLEISTMSHLEFSVDFVFKTLRKKGKEPTLGNDLMATKRAHDKHFKLDLSHSQLLVNCLNSTLGNFYEVADFETLIKTKIWNKEDEKLLKFLRSMMVHGEKPPVVSQIGNDFVFRNPYNFCELYELSHPSFKYDNLLKVFEIVEALSDEEKRETHHRSYGDSKNPHNSREIHHRSYEEPGPHFLNTPHKSYDRRRRNEYEEMKPRTGNPFYITDEDYERKQRKEKYRREFVEDLKQAMKYVDYGSFF